MNACGQITGKLIKEKYNLREGIELGNKLREERIEWMKHKQNSI